MATLKTLHDRKRELEERLASGDLSAESALERVDRAIMARTQQLNYSQKRMTAVKAAVAEGVQLKDTTPKKIATRNRNTKSSPINRFK